MKYSLSAHGSIHLNRKLGGKFPHLTVCAEAWILHRTGRVFLFDLICLILFWERSHCKKQYLKYNANKETPK